MNLLRVDLVVLPLTGGYAPGLYVALLTVVLCVPIEQPFLVSVCLWGPGGRKICWHFGGMDQ